MKALSLAAVLGGFFVWSAAAADTVCGLHESFVTALEADYAETERGRGLMPTGQLIELFVSPRESFTILVTTPEGISCVVATGQDWEPVREPAISLPFSEGRVP